jgi:N-acetylglucosamine-6-phosphate deacetylase
MRYALQGARILLDGELRRDRAVIVRDGVIEAVMGLPQVPEGVIVHELDGGILAPGFIDTQVNGGGGALFNDEPSADTIRTIGEAHRRYGTTGFLPTLISDNADKVMRALQAVDDAIAAEVPGVLGIHLEGPFLAPKKSGIHDVRNIVAADEALLDVIAAPRRGITMVTLAPEIVGSRTIERLARAGVIVSAGHTDATYEQTVEALSAGVRGFTHLFNVMSPMTSRAPGPIGAALDDFESWCGIIADGEHVHPAVLRIALRSRPVNRFMLVTDAMPPVGTDATAFSLQGRTIRVEDGRCLDEAGTLAGSSLDMATAVRNCTQLLDVPLPKALELASGSPAEFLRLDHRRGRIAAGMAADMVWLDDMLHVRSTWIDGAETVGHEVATRTG